MKKSSAMKALTTRNFLTAILLAGFFVGVAQSQEAGGDISQSEIVSLQKELAEASEASSSSRMRRAYKGIVRDAEGLLEASPSAAKRYRVLDIVVQKYHHHK